MSHLVVQPGTPQAWEIQLKPGINSIGRRESNDFVVNDPSVSGSHCQVVIGEGSAVLTDCGSTNGTFVDKIRVQQQNLEHGKNVRLGSVEMIYYSGAAVPVAVVVATAVSAKPALRVNIPAAPPVSPPPPPAMPPVAVPSATAAVGGTRSCKSHPKSPARFLCNHCDRTYCDLCVNLTDTGGRMVPTCRTCREQLVPFQFYKPPDKGFYAKLPGAFIYPFKGMGIVILLCATVAFAAMDFIGGGIFGIVIKVALFGFVFLFMQNIITSTTSDEEEPLAFPEASGLFGAAFQLAGTVIASFWLAIGLAIARFFVDIPSVAILASVILGGIYFPMALLVVAMKDSVAAANPLVVIPAMLKLPVKYGITVVLLLGVFGIRKLGDLISSGAGEVTFTTHDMGTLLVAMAFQAVWALVSVYLLTVTMRILGLFYNSSKRELGWFSS